ncbi:hypothetical protein GDO78_015971 [Eleutherodactylus coqui]|uniref:Uncharacterized protein n=1 Tax=Eleutherodactylus coqui TaxID=57060 RepID=A0A8J6E8F2_ELECQ|nr:hypothetical protein GDO78_015971 [Eleutherodactylus coqui]
MLAGRRLLMASSRWLQRWSAPRYAVRVRTPLFAAIGPLCAQSITSFTAADKTLNPLFVPTEKRNYLKYGFY